MCGAYSSNHGMPHSIRIACSPSSFSTRSVFEEPEEQDDCELEWNQPKGIVMKQEQCVFTELQQF